jgi:FixJ family two-component response regulator
MQNSDTRGRRDIVVVIDEDTAVLGALRFALELEGFSVAGYRSASEFLDDGSLPSAGCLIVEFNLPDMTGLELVEALRRKDIRLPAILITTNPPRGLLKRAAAERIPIVEKPLLGDALVNAIRHALAQPV